MIRLKPSGQRLGHARRRPRHIPRRLRLRPISPEARAEMQKTWNSGEPTSGFEPLTPSLRAKNGPRASAYACMRQHKKTPAYGAKAGSFMSARGRWRRQGPGCWCARRVRDTRPIRRYVVHLCHGRGVAPMSAVSVDELDPATVRGLVARASDPSASAGCSRSAARGRAAIRSGCAASCCTATSGCTRPPRARWRVDGPLRQPPRGVLSVVCARVPRRHVAARLRRPGRRPQRRPRAGRRAPPGLRQPDGAVVRSRSTAGPTTAGRAGAGSATTPTTRSSARRSTRRRMTTRARCCGTGTPPRCGTASSSSWPASSPHRAGLSERAWRKRVRIAFAKVAEFQARGLVHFHAIIRLDGAEDRATAPGVDSLARGAVRRDPPGRRPCPPRR